MSAVRVLCAAAWLAASLGASADELGLPLEIRVLGDDWNASHEDIRRVLHSAAEPLLRYVPDRKLAPILVSRHPSCPITFYQKGPGGEYRVGLNTGSTYWCQYAYQFAHELGHILAHCDRRSGPTRHQWFEEALCETASLFVLLRLAETWHRDPPYPHFRDFAPRFEEYANAMLARRERRLPPDVTMPQWLARNLPELERQTAPSEQSRLVATYLLAWFEEEPQGWAALNWYHLEQRDSQADFRLFLEAWRDRAP